MEVFGVKMIGQMNQKYLSIHFIITMMISYLLYGGKMKSQYGGA